MRGYCFFFQYVFLFCGGANSPRQNTESALATSLANCLPAYLKPRPILLEIQRLAQDLRIRPDHKQKRRPAHSVRRAALRYVYHRLTETAVLSGGGPQYSVKNCGRWTVAAVSREPIRSGPFGSPASCAVFCASCGN